MRVDEGARLILVTRIRLGSLSIGGWRLGCLRSSIVFGESSIVFGESWVVLEDRRTR